MRIQNQHVYFWGGRYSNFYGCRISYALCAETKPIDFNCSEQIFMAHKALHFGDFDALSKIVKSAVPREQKGIGRTVVGFDQAEWSKVCYDYMVRAVYAKFSQNMVIQEHLLTLSDHTFVEASPLDRVWGVGLAEEDDRILDKANWKGTNLLGEAINEVANRIALEHLLKLDEDIASSWEATDA